MVNYLIVVYASFIKILTFLLNAMFKTLNIPNLLYKQNESIFVFWLLCKGSIVKLGCQTPPSQIPLLICTQW